ncbi:MAG: Smr/MutS family protein, partial [Anaerolineales bacterium]|nr:Smr/MutS family protein [Anaerolineales bacterium]
RHIRDADSLNKLKKLGKQAEQIEANQLKKSAPAIAGPEITKQKAPELQVGDTVLIKTLNTKGDIVSLSKKEAVVVIGRLQMRAKLVDLEFKSRPEAEQPEESTGIKLGSSPGMELDLRGKRVEEGLNEVAGYIDSAFLARLPWVRIIHGKGTGRLRTAVRKALKQNPHVASWEEGKDGEGGAGVTVAKLIEHT